MDRIDRRLNDLQSENDKLKETASKRSAQIGDLKNKLIKAQQEVIELKDKQKEIRDVVYAFDLDGINDAEHLKHLKEVVYAFDIV